jgi:hypothetical protein
VADHLTTASSRGGAGTITAVLPNGRIIWLRVAPPLATELAVERLARLAAVSAERRRAATREVAASVRSASSTLARDSARVTRAHLRRTNAVRRRLVKAYSRLDRRLAASAINVRKSKNQTRHVIDETARRLGTRSLWDSILLAGAPLLFAAYGERGRPFGPNNLTLWLSQLVWLAGDEVVDMMFGREHKSPYPLDAPDTWSYIAPFGNLLAGWWLLDGRQHERFVVGRTPLSVRKAETRKIEGTTRFSYRFSAVIDLTTMLAEEHAPDFVGFTNVPAVASLTSVQWTPAAAAQHAVITGITAEVAGGVLELAVMADATGEIDGSGTSVAPDILTALDVAWLVDSMSSGANVE